MAETFHDRIPTLADEALREYARKPLAYKREAVAAALAELARRGLALPEAEARQIQAELDRRDAGQGEARDTPLGRLLGATEGSRRVRVRRLTAAILAVGLGSAAAIFAMAPAPAANPLGYEPTDTKKYLRELEVFGGRSNVLATEFSEWFGGLWRGRRLAGTVACLTVALAGGFWFVAGPAHGDGGPAPRP
jgi:hypothetical protein